MDLKSPSTLVTAWLLVPALVTLTSLGLGAGLRVVSGLELGALTLPAGFLSGVAVISLLLGLGLNGKPASAVCGVVALAGPGWLLARRRTELRAWRPDGGHWWALGCGAAAYAIGMAPLAGSGRSGVLGYVLNNDTAFHITLVENLAQTGADPTRVTEDSFHGATSALDSGYPIGSYAWPLFGRLLGGIDVFHIWSPLIALTAAMTALVAYSLLRDIGAPRAFASVAGALVASGYLPFSYLAQGGAKEVLMPLAVLCTVALLGVALRPGAGWRGLLPAALASAAAIANFGYPALAWIGPAGACLAGVLALRAWRARSWDPLRPLLPYVALSALVALPTAAASIDFVSSSRSEFGQEDEIGNLLQDLPIWQLFNVWFGGDYRVDPAESEALSQVFACVAGASAVVGVLYALSRRAFAVPVAIVAAVLGSLVVTPGVSIYFDAKTYVIIAPAVGLASAAGVLALATRGGLVRDLGAAVGVALAIGVLVSAGWVYTDVWNTPRDRFEELSQIAERVKERGPILLHERDEYAIYWLRKLGPWGDWGERPVVRGFRGEGNFPPGLPHTPDFDDYELEHLQRFRLLLERRRPGGSLPPANYRPVLETRHYRVWRREGPAPREHLPLGSGLLGAERLRCDSPEVSAFLERARAAGTGVDAALPAPRPLVAIAPQRFQITEHARVLPARGQAVARRGGAIARMNAPPGDYDVWLQGSYGPVARVTVGREAVFDTYGDLGLPDAWQPLGTVGVTPGESITLQLLGRGWWFPGDRHASLIGPVVIVPKGGEPRVERFPPDRLRELCGRELDWLEIPS